MFFVFWSVVSSLVACQEQQKPSVIDNWTLGYEKKICEPDPNADIFSTDQFCHVLSMFRLSIDSDRHGYFELEGSYTYLMAGGDYGFGTADGDLVANPNGKENGYKIEMDGDSYYTLSVPSADTYEAPPEDYELVLDCEIISEGSELKCVGDNSGRYTFDREN